MRIEIPVLDYCRGIGFRPLTEKAPWERIWIPQFMRKHPSSKITSRADWSFIFVSQFECPSVYCRRIVVGFDVPDFDPLIQISTDVDSTFRESPQLVALLKEMKVGLDAVRSKVQALTVKVDDVL